MFSNLVRMKGHPAASVGIEAGDETAGLILVLAPDFIPYLYIPGFFQEK
jgi:hypothetical protein